jgi:hypothetical protein
MFEPGGDSGVLGCWLLARSSPNGGRSTPRSVLASGVPVQGGRLGVFPSSSCPSPISRLCNRHRKWPHQAFERQCMVRRQLGGGARGGGGGPARGHGGDEAMSSGGSPHLPEPGSQVPRWQELVLLSPHGRRRGDSVGLCRCGWWREALCSGGALHFCFPCTPCGFSALPASGTPGVSEPMSQPGMVAPNSLPAP